jgi:cytochrome c-type biogenesis protein CcmF
MTEADIGQAAGLLALVCAAYACLGSVIGAGLPKRWNRRPALIRSASRAVVATGILIAISIGALLYALWTHDFSLKYVADYSNLEVAPAFNISSLWAGQAGSLMFWCLLLNAFAIAALWQNRGGRNSELMPWVMAALMGYQTFFLLLINSVVESPWLRYDPAPSDGQGLMPLLQHPTMLFHPPSLYLGYVAFCVPFAFAIAALITGRVDDEWTRTTRRWTLLAWFFLGCGLLLGGNWAYNELGWGGYWAWDPVENVALMPFLTGTAFLHSIMIQQQRGMLKVWNMVLIITTFALTLFGTFMNRSGVASSVHSFEGSGLGVPFVILIGATVALSFALVYYRLPGLAAVNRLDSYLSRESAFLFNNLLLIGIAFAVFWGTIFPILSEVLRGPAGKVTVGAPFFDKVTGPLFLALLLFMAAGPLLPWRRASRDNLRRNLLRPLVVGAAAGVVGIALTRNVAASLSFAVCAMVVASVVVEFYRGTRAKRRATGFAWPRALVHLVDSNHARYGGYLVHLGIGLVALGVTGSTLLKVDSQALVRLGQSFSAGAYQVQPLQLLQEQMPGVGPAVTAVVRVTQNGQQVAVLRPSLVQYQSQGGQWIAQIALRSTPLEDFYVTLSQTSSTQKDVRLHVLVNPLVWWIWCGGIVVILGGLIAFTPGLPERRAALVVAGAVPAVAR